MATWDDVPHLDQAAKDELRETIPEYQRDARTKGVPQLGEGAVFPFDEETIKCDAFSPPKHWAQLGAMDFGWDHPFAAVHMAWDKDNDVVYVCNAYRKRQATPLIHCDVIGKWGWPKMPWAWPHDGQHHKGNDARALADLYQAQGLNILPDFARFEDGGWGLESGIQAMLGYVEPGRLKVFRHLSDWWEEDRLYHRKNGKVVAISEDLMSATRYGIMDLRFAEIEKPRTADYLKRAETKTSHMAA